MTSPTDKPASDPQGTGFADAAQNSAAGEWNDRYGAEERVWSADPNVFVAEFVNPLAAGTAIDVAAGEGRHALWLADNGWNVQAFDISDVGVSKGVDQTERAGLQVDWSVASVEEFAPDPATVDLVVMAYVHLDIEHMVTHVMPRVRSWLAPGGHLVMVNHGKRNLKHGVGGPQDASILPTIGDMERFGMGLMILCAEERIRTVDAGDAIDVVLHAVATS